MKLSWPLKEAAVCAGSLHKLLLIHTIIKKPDIPGTSVPLQLKACENAGFFQCITEKEEKPAIVQAFWPFSD
ncbi:hypothetical protein HQN90_16360 [Paenibacillus alba]|uniref:hypothetical protein n=1 Tax=Paenibacillus alba TaxID=1197127 RepID=UPI0015638EA9|nr:hypothetical protein [Paenibacillus alba]NQX67695.1 hypothetical protein [Paenibacillus alba]